MKQSRNVKVFLGIFDEIVTEQSYRPIQLVYMKSWEVEGAVISDVKSKYWNITLDVRSVVVRGITQI